MQSEIELDILELKEFLLSIAPDRPVFIWGPPGIGKSSMVQTFSNEVGFECVYIIGSQLPPTEASDSVENNCNLEGVLNLLF